MKWTESKACESRRFCASCRGSEAFRQTIVNSKGVEELNFPCPHGITEHNLHHGLGSLVERIAKPIAKALKLPCYKDGKLRPSSPCGKRKITLNILSAKILG